MSIYRDDYRNYDFGLKAKHHVHTCELNGKTHTWRCGRGRGCQFRIKACCLDHYKIAMIAQTVAEKMTGEFDDCPF